MMRRIPRVLSPPFGRAGRWLPNWPPEEWRRLGSNLLTGIILGMFGGLECDRAGFTVLIPPLRNPHLFVYTMVAGGLISLTRLRALLWIVDGVICFIVLIVACTPVMEGRIAGLITTDRLARSDAVVVLSSSVMKSGKLDAEGETRLEKAIEILRGRWAQRLIITYIQRPMLNEKNAVARELSSQGLRVDLEAVGPVRNTHDEAVDVAALAHARGWKRIILVTSPLHTRRAAAAFRKTGLLVISQPCPERSFDLNDLSTPFARLMAFNAYLRETAGYEQYHLSGWI